MLNSGAGVSLMVVVVVVVVGSAGVGAGTMVRGANRGWGDMVVHTHGLVEYVSYGCRLGGMGVVGVGGWWFGLGSRLNSLIRR